MVRSHVEMGPTRLGVVDQLVTDALINEAASVVRGAKTVHMNVRSSALIAPPIVSGRGAPRQP